MTGVVSRKDQPASRSRQAPGDVGSSTAVRSNGSSLLESPLIRRATETETTESHGFHERQSSSWIASLVTHLVLLLSLSLLSVNVQSVQKRIVMQIPLATDESRHDQELETFQILERPEPDVEPALDVEEIDDVVVEIESDPLVSIASVHQMPAMVDPIESLAMILATPSPPAYLLPAKPAVQREAGSDVDGEQGQTGSGGKPGAGTDGELGMRTVRRMRFSTPEMDYAINNSLFWLARHQQPDGGWSFEHRGGECRGRCPNPGSKTDARVAATGLALLPFLGAGHSPDHGEFRRTVAAGINFLISNTARNGSLWRREGRMYGQGIATLALCECYGIMKQSPLTGDTLTGDRLTGDRLTGDRLTGDRRIDPTAMGTPNDAALIHPAPNAGGAATTVDIQQLELAAKAAVEFIVRAQAADGGWRYEPRELGDTSVVGWQVMAIKSATDAGLGTYEQTNAAASRFLDAVQGDVVHDRWYGSIGTQYAYQPRLRFKTEATTAIGLACRIYMGTTPFHPGMRIAAQRIASRGPIGGDMYYNYYANQVLFQHGGAEWKEWSEKLNLALMLSQEDRGHLQGSWFFGGRNRGGDHGGDAGGRLYATAMACLCLEETFRHLPIFRAVDRLEIAVRPKAENQDPLPAGENAPTQQERSPWDFSDADPAVVKTED